MLTAAMLQELLTKLLAMVNAVASAIQSHPSATAGQANAAADVSSHVAAVQAEHPQHLA